MKFGQLTDITWEIFFLKTYIKFGGETKIEHIPG